MQDFEELVEINSQEISNKFSLADKAIIALIIASYVKVRDTSDTMVSLGILKILTDLEKKIFPLVKKNIETYYMASVKEVDQRITNIDIKNALQAISEADKIQINALTSQTINDLSDSIKGAFNSSQKVITMVKSKRLDYLLSDEGLSKANLTKLKDEIENEISKNFVGLIDKSGRRWQIDTYAEMLTRTRLREVADNAVISRLQNYGYDLVEVTSHGTICDLCKPYEGRILSITGRTKGYPSLDEARAGGFEHPNCLHRLMPYFPEFEIDTMV